jgi:rubrerythrin
MATDTKNGTVDEKLAQWLHLPGRIDHLDNLETHLWKAASLSRALWLAVANEELSSDDERTRRALTELANEVADHASAAEYLFHNEAAAGAKAEG